jgi:N-acetylmuramoyl-L-alanine amidase
MYKIVIDPGHGGKDRSNMGPTGYIEADGVLAISKYLRDELIATKAFEVLLTRGSDITIGLTERGKMAAEFGADLFISEHTNASGRPTNENIRGTVVYYSVDLPQDKELAYTMAKEIAEAIGTTNKGAKTHESTKYPGEDYYTVIDASQDRGIPHVLLAESAFHDNAKDEALLKDDAVLRKIAKAQAKVICNFFKVSLNIPKTPVTPKEPVVPKKPTLKIGLKDNDDVRELQKVLKVIGYKISVDGSFGPATERVVKEFQDAFGLDADGVVSTKTWDAIYLIKDKISTTKGRGISGKIKNLLKLVKGDK